MLRVSSIPILSRRLFRLFFSRQTERKLQGLPHYARNLWKYNQTNTHTSFKFSRRDAYYRTYDKFEPAGSTGTDYFFQDIWAARRIYEQKTAYHVDVASRLDEFVGHCLPFCRVCYVDIRPLVSTIDGLEFKQGLIENLPFDSDSVESLSCLHVIEHIGLGRYGDPVNPDGYLEAARELARVLAPGGKLYLGTPVGRERLCFDAHRVFDPATILAAFSDLSLREFSLVDDAAQMIHYDADFAEARKCHYGCGLFIFEKKAAA